MHQQYKETLFDTKQLWHGKNILRSEGHEIYGMHANKIPHYTFDSKGWIADDSVHTNANGHINMPIWPTLTDDELREFNAAISELNSSISDSEMLECRELLGV